MANEVYFDTGAGNKRRLLSIKAICEARHDIEELWDALLGLHAFSGCDSVSAFVRKGKIQPLKCLLKNRNFIPCFMSLGNCPDMTDNVMHELERFVCSLYGRPGNDNVNKVRYDIFKQKFKVRSSSLVSTLIGTDLSLLPPCQKALQMHILRANYQTLIWKRANEAYPDIPLPAGHGWRMNDGVLSINWFEGDLLPKELTDVLVSNETAVEEYDDSEDDTSVEYNNLVDVIFSSDDEDDFE